MLCSMQMLWPTLTHRSSSSSSSMTAQLPRRSPVYVIQLPHRGKSPCMHRQNVWQQALRHGSSFWNCTNNTSSTR